jgi:hypothetical protein
MSTQYSRREFLTAAGVATFGAVAGRAATAEKPVEFTANVSVRAITRGPRFHWFGYYDKFEFDPSGRRVLAMEVDFEGRSPRADDVIRVGMVDLQDGDKWIELGTSRAWNWQQGCMLQWLPGSASTVVWNDRQDDHFVCHVLDVESGKKRTLPAPIYTLSPDGKWAVAPDFRRLNDCRPGYGYAGLSDPNTNVLAPEDAGIWKMDMETGKQSLLLSFAEVAKFPQVGGYSKSAKHWFNHLLVSPDGKRFEFLHRWRGEAEGKSWKTRMFTVGADGKDLFLLNASGKVSHFIWRDSTHILAYAGWGEKEWRCQLFEDRTGKSELVEGMLPVDGHCTYLPGDQWILCDTYPDKQRYQNPYLLHLPTKKYVALGQFRLPPEYKGEWRCDLHPRCSPDGKWVAMDSAHHTGRQIYLLDLRGVI